MDLRLAPSLRRSFFILALLLMPGVTSVTAVERTRSTRPITMLRVLPCDTTNVTAVAFSPDGSLVAGGGDDGTLYVWDPLSGRLAHVAKHISPIRSVAFLPDGKLLAAGPQLSFAPDSRRVAALGRYFTEDSTRTLGVFVISSGRQRTLAVPEQLAAEVLVWDSLQGQILWTAGIGNDESSLAWSSDGKILMTGGSHTTHATASRSATLTTWDGATGAIHPPAPHLPLSVYPYAVSENMDVAAVAFSANSQLLLTAESAHAAEANLILRWWNVRTGRELRRTALHVPKITAVMFSPNRQLIAIANNDRSLSVWQVNTGRRMWAAKPGLLNQSVIAIAFSPSGKTFITAGGDGVRFWRLD